MSQYTHDEVMACADDMEATSPAVIRASKRQASAMLRAYAATLRQQATRVDDKALAALDRALEAVNAPLLTDKANERAAWEAVSVLQSHGETLRAALSAQPAPDAEVERGLAFRSGARWADANQDSGGEPRVLQLCREANSYAASPYRWDKWPQPAPERQGEDFEEWFTRQDSRIEWPEMVRLAYHAHPAAPVGVPEPLPMDAAPRDGTMLRLLVRFTEHPTDDAEEAWTIGSNSFDANGEDMWQFAGWCWSHDHFTEGKGTPVGWLPMLDNHPRAASTLRHDQIHRHQIAAGACPPASMVLLVSSVQRMLAAAPSAPQGTQQGEG